MGRNEQIMSDEKQESSEEFKDKIKSVQVPRKPHVEQKSAEGSTQTYHTTGRVDANIMVPTVEVKAAQPEPVSDESGNE